MDPELLGRVLGGHYRLDARIGEGATGIVFRARHTLLEQDFAVKVLNPRLAGDAELRERFLREARSLTRFAHANAVQVRHCGDEDGLLYLVMDLCAGETLDAILEREGRLPEERAIRIVLQVLDALDEAHRAGIVHRDLKPSNIMVEGDAVKVVDFGLARILATDTPVPGGELTIAGGLVGTVAYMSPEQLRAEPVDHRSDLFSVGIILREISTGARPFDGGSPATIMVRILEHEPEPLPDEVAARLSPRLHEVVARSLEKDRARRFQTAAAFADALRARTDDAPPPSPRRLPPAVVAVALFGIAALVLAGAWSYFRDRATEERAAHRAAAGEAFLSARFEKAIRLVSRIVLTGRATGEDFLLRGRARAELARPEARDDLARAADLLPGDPRVPTALARLEWLLGDAAAAESALRRALRADPAFLPARVERVRTLIRGELLDIRRWIAHVRNEIEQLAKHAPESVWPGLLEAEFLDKRAAFDPEADKNELRYQARLVARQAYESDPRLADAAALLGQLRVGDMHVLRQAGRETEAMERARTAVTRYEEAIARARAAPGHHEQGSRMLLFLRGRINAFYWLQDGDAAVPAIEEFVRLNPTDPEQLRWAGHHLTLVGGQEEAEAIHERLLGIVSSDPQVHSLLGTNIMLQGVHYDRCGDRKRAMFHYRRARDVFRKGLALDPAHRDLNNYGAEVCVKLAALLDDNEAEKKALLEEAKTALAPGDNLHRRAEYHLLAGDPQAALRDMREELSDEAGTPAMVARLARALIAVAKAEPPRARELGAEALVACRRLRASNPEANGPIAGLLTGDAHRVMGQPEAALQAYRGVVQITGDTPRTRAEAHFRAAEILLELDRPDDAVAEARKAVAIREAEAEAGVWFGLARDRERLDAILEKARSR